MNKLFYPAIFHVAEEGGFWITFPDLPECMTQGDNMQEAYEMAVEALGLAISNQFFAMFMDFTCCFPNCRIRTGFHRLNRKLKRNYHTYS